MGRGLLPFLAVMLLAAPQLAFAQDSLAVSVNPRSVDIDEEGTLLQAITRCVLDAEPSGGCDDNGSRRTYRGRGHCGHCGHSGGLR